MQPKVIKHKFLFQIKFLIKKKINFIPIQIIVLIFKKGENFSENERKEA